jgi:predicted nucleotidyltransferase
MNQIDFNNEQVINLYNKYHVKTLRIFGSMARGESRIDSDVDLLVTFSKPISLLQMVGLERELSAIIGRKVDLLTTKSVSRYLRNRILKESRQIYAA